MYKAFIADDEYLARERVKRLLQEYTQQVEILGEADCGTDAIQQIEELRPDVVFLDIQMPDMTGFEVLSELTYQPMIIFTTAYEEYAIKAFDAYSLDYLVKPFNVARFKMAMEKLEKFGNHHTPVSFEEVAEKMFPKKPAPPAFSLPIKVGDRILLIDFEDISHIQAEDKYARIHTQNGKKYLSDNGLTKLQQKLPGHFLRVHRSFIVNQAYIKEVRKFFKGKLVLILNDKEGTKITTGETYSGKVKKALGL